MCTAMSAARLGATGALIQDRPVLGGNNSSEIRVWLNGDTNFEPYPHVGDLVHEFEQRRRQEIGPAKNYDDEARIAAFRAAKNIRLMLDERVNRVEMAGGRIAAVVSQNTRTALRTRIAGRWFADCTGDANVGFLAGADYDMTKAGHQGGTDLWTTEETGKPSPFPRCPWAYDLSKRPFPSHPYQWGKWFWESGFDRDPIADTELMRDNNFRAMYGAWDAIKNARKLYPNRRLRWAAYVMGKRESRRLLGDVVLSREDLLAGKAYPDGCVPTSWSIDLHLADPRYSRDIRRPIHSLCCQSLRTVQPALLGALSLPLFAERAEPVHGRAGHQRDPRGAGHDPRAADDRHDGRGRRHGRRALQEVRRRSPRRLCWTSR